MGRRKIGDAALCYQLGPQAKGHLDGIPHARQEVGDAPVSQADLGVPEEFGELPVCCRLVHRLHHELVKVAGECRRGVPDAQGGGRTVGNGACIDAWAGELELQASLHQVAQLGNIGQIGSGSPDHPGGKGEQSVMQDWHDD